MNQAREIYTVKEGKASLREYVIPATNKHRFEVKNGRRVIYEGESYREARSLYQELSQKRAEPVKKAIDAMSTRPKRRGLKLRNGYNKTS